MVGLDRRWDFGDELAYAFIIRPDGEGMYYDFSEVDDDEKTGPSQHFFCSRTVGMAAPWPPSMRIPKPKPPPPKRVAEAAPEAYKFDADRIAELIDKTPRKRSAPETPETPRAPPRIASRTAQPLAGQPLTLSEVDALKTQIERCWIVQAGARYAEDLVVTIRVFLNPDGSLRREPQIVDDKRLAGDPFFRAAAASAIRAVLKCEPFKMPFTKYHRWREIELTFDPREMLR